MGAFRGNLFKKRFSPSPFQKLLAAQNAFAEKKNKKCTRNACFQGVAGVLCSAVLLEILAWQVLTAGKGVALRKQFGRDGDAFGVSVRKEDIKECGEGVFNTGKCFIRSLFPGFSFKSARPQTDGRPP